MLLAMFRCTHVHDNSIESYIFLLRFARKKMFLRKAVNIFLVPEPMTEASQKLGKNLAGGPEVLGVTLKRCIRFSA